MKKRALCWLLALVMILSLVPVSVLALDDEGPTADPKAVAEDKEVFSPGEMTTDSMVTNKYLTANGDAYDLTMTAYATGGTMTQELESDVPLDIVLVIDQSGSMKSDDISAGWQAQNGPWTVEQAIGWYHKVGDLYYEVKADRGTVYTATVRPALSDSLMGVNGESLHTSWNNWKTPYKVKDSNGNLVDLYVRTQGYVGGYDAQFYYYENGSSSPTYIPFTNGSYTASYSRGGIGTGSMDSNSYRLNTTVYKASTGYKSLYYVDAQGNRVGTLGDAVTSTTDIAWDGPLYYDSNQTRLQALQQAAQKFVESVGARAEATGVDHRVAIAGFASNKYPSGSTTKNDIVSGGHQYTYVNTGLFVNQNGTPSFENFNWVNADSDFEQVTSGPVYDNKLYYYATSNRGPFYPLRKVNSTWYRYSWNSENELVGTSINITNAINNGYIWLPTMYPLTDSDYQNALVSVRNNDGTGNHVNDFLDQSIDMLGAYGGTYVSYGIAMANQVFAHNSNIVTNSDGSTTERKRVIVVFTDGEPGANGYDPNIANEALNNAAISKDTYGAAVYTVGLFVEDPQTGEAVVTQDTRDFIHALSSEYYTSMEKVYEEDLDVTGTYYFIDDYGMVNAATTTDPSGYSLLCGWLLNQDGSYNGIYRYPRIKRNDNDSSRAQFYSRSGNSFSEIWVQAQRWTSWGTTYSTPAMSIGTVYYSVRNNQYQPFLYDYRWNNAEGDMVDPVPRTYTSPNETRQFYRIKSTLPTNQGTYAFEKADAAGLASAFQTISEQIQTPYTTVSLDTTNSYFQDTITKEFTVPAGAQAELSVQRLAYDAASGKAVPVAEDDPARAQSIVSGLSQSWTTQDDGSKTLKVEGFDYSAYYVAEGHPGYQLVVKVSGLTTTGLGKLYSNDSNSGVFKEGALVAPLPMPYVTKEAAPQTYVIDFNGKMKIAEDATFQIAVNEHLGENGIFVKSGNADAAGTITYQLTSDTQTAAQGTTIEINQAYSSADTATIYGKFYTTAWQAGTEGAAPASVSTLDDTASWKNVTVIPASSIYFDDDLGKADAAAVTVGDGSGYNAQIEASSPDADAVNTQPGVYNFTFTGTGIDVYCTTYDKDSANNTAGYAQATILLQNGQIFAVNGEKQVQTMRNQSNTTRYNVPTFSFHDLPQGTYTLKLTILSSSNYKLDGIRVYNPVADQSLYADNGAAQEQYATFINLREALVNDNGVSQAFTDNMTDAVLGALFVDDTSKLTRLRGATDEEITAGTGIVYVDAEGNEVSADTPGAKAMINAYANQFEAYKGNSPKHEIYLENKDNNKQAIIFTLTADGVAAAQNGDLWIGLSAPDMSANGGIVTLKDAQGDQPAKTIDVKNAVDMYYPISKDMITVNTDGTGTVMIKNTGSSMISVTNLKITGNETIYTTANPSAATPASVDGAVAESVADVLPLVFEPMTMHAVKIAANGGVDPDAQVVEPDDPGTPDTPDEPVEPDKPIWSDPMNFLKTLFDLLLKSLSNLFSGLGGW